MLLEFLILNNKELSKKRKVIFKEELSIKYQIYY